MRKLIALVPSFALLACGGGDKPVVDPTTTAQTTTTATASASSTTPTPPSAAGTSAYSFVIGAAGCWLGGSWAEAEGETQKAERKKAVEARCADVSKMLTGSPDKVEQLRALEPAITDSMGARVIEFAKNDHLDAAHTENLVKLVTAVGTAQREALLARRASEKIKGDLDKLSTDKEEDAAREKDSDKLTADEAGIVAQLKPTAALEALMNLQAGDYSHDGKAIALLTAIGRVDHARGLPKHMKVYAAGSVLRLVFGVTPPAVGEDVKAKLVPGTWLAYLTDVAKAANHAVPDTAKTPKEREPFAWAGMVAGFSDKLKVEQPQTQGELANVLTSTAGHLDAIAQMASDKGALRAGQPDAKKPDAKKPDAKKPDAKK